MAHSDHSRDSPRLLAESRFPLYSITASALLLAAAIWFAVLTRISTEHELTTRAIETQGANLAFTYESAVRASLRRVDDLLHLAGERGAEALADRLRPTAELAALVSYVAVVRPSGEVSTAVGQPAPQRIDDEGFLAAVRRATSRERVFSKPHAYGADGRMLFWLGRMVSGPRADDVLVLAALDPRYYYDLFDRANLGRDGVVALTGLDGLVRARAGDPKSISGQNIADSVLFELLKTRSQGQYFAASRHDHIARRFSYQAVADYPLVITVGVSEDAAYGDWGRRRLSYLLGASLATLLLVAAAAGWLHLLLVQRRRAEGVEASAQNYRRLFEDNPLPMWVTDPQHQTFLMVNDTAIAHYGYAREEFLRLRSGDILPLEESPQGRAGAGASPQLGVTDGIWRHRKKNGEIITVRLTHDELVYMGRPAILTVAEDITERLRAEERLKLALQSSRTAIWEWDLGLDRVYLSDEVYQLLDRAPGSIDLSKGVLPFIAPEDGAQFREAVREVLHSIENHPEMEGELRAITGRGEKRWLHYCGRLFHDAAGKPARMHGVVVDITQRKRAEAELKRSEERFRHVFQTINVGYAQTDFVDGTMRLVNPGLVRLLGAKSERELLGRSSREFFIDPEERERFKKALLNNGHVDNFPVTLKRIDGQIVYVLLSDFLLRGSDGVPQIIEGVLIDVTPLRQAEIELRRSKEVLQGIFDATLESLVMVDREGRVLALNTTAARQLGGTPESLVGAKLSDRHPANVAAQRRAWVSEVLESGRALIGEDELGSRIYSTHHYPVRDESGTVQAVVLFSHDVTDRRRSEALLAESEARLRALMSALPDLVFTCDGEGRLIEWLSGEIPGGTTAPLRAGSELAAALPLDEDSGIVAGIRACAQTGESAAREFSLATTQGVFWYEIRATRVAAKPGGAPAVVCVARNITARRDTEAQMAAARTRLLNTLESMIVGVLEVNRDGRIRYANAAASEILEAPTEDLIGQHFQHDLGKRWHQIDAEGSPLSRDQLSLKVTLTQMRPVRQVDTGLRSPEGRIKWLHLNSTPLLDAEGKITGAVVNFEDVTQARAALRALRETNRLNHQIINSAREGIVVVDEQLRFIVWNPAMAAIFGISPESILGKHIDDGFSFAGREMVLQAYRRAFAGEVVNLPDLHFSVAATGRNGWATGRHSPLRDSEGTIIGVIAVVADITERKEREQEIERLNATLEQRVRDRTAELQAVNRELESFSYSVSHDLRAPLRSIDGFSELLIAQYGDQIDQNAKRYLQRVRANAQHMATLIDQLLELARVARAELHRQPIDLSSIARGIAHALSGQSPERLVEWRIAEHLPVQADAQLLRIVLENLLGNAWKFTAGRSPALIEFGEEDSEDGRRYFVRDNGAGFDMAYAGKLFGAFQRLHRPEEFSGTGVGLASVKRIVTMHGGQVWAEGEPGVGACFRFTLA